MSKQSSTTQHKTLLKSQTHPRHQPNLVASNKPTKQSNDSEDVVFLKSVPKVEHTPEEYDPECKCSTCRLVRKLMAECTCKECREQQSHDVNQIDGQVVQSSKNITIHNGENAPFESSIQNNDTSANGHISKNRRDNRLRSPTPDYVPRFFDDESESDSSSDDSEDDDLVDGGDDKKIDQKNESDDDDDNNSDQSYTFSRPITNKSGKKSTNQNNITTDSGHKCPLCNLRYKSTHNLIRHYRENHQQLKPYYCKWPMCDYTTGRRDGILGHICLRHFNRRKGSNKAKSFIGKRKLASPKDPILERLLKSLKITIGQSACPQCKRKLPESQFGIHLRTHNRPGFRCTYHGCGFFFSRTSEASKHICADHLHVETANSQQVNRHLIKVNPLTGETGIVQVRAKRRNVSDYSRKLLTSSNKSNSSESSNSDNEQTDQIKCPKCAKTFIERHKLVRHYRSVHQKWKPFYCRWHECHFASGVYDTVVHHANRKHFNSQNRQKARKYVGEREKVPPKDPVLRQIIATKFGRIKKAK